MQTNILVTPQGYDFKANAIVSTTAAQLDLLLAALIERVKDANVEQLEWQPRRGVNTIGMLLAHIAVAEVYWVSIADRRIESDEELDQLIQDIVGIRMEEDGIPISKDDVHPRALAGKTAAGYLAMLRRARAMTHESLRDWEDSSLQETWMTQGRVISRSWVLYHLVEHFAHHLGQLSQLVSLNYMFQCG